MSTVVGIGATHEMEGFALAGVRVIPAASAAEVTAAWAELDADVGLVILSAGPRGKNFGQSSTPGPTC